MLFDEIFHVCESLKFEVQHMFHLFLILRHI